MLRHTVVVRLLLALTPLEVRDTVGVESRIGLQEDSVSSAHRTCRMRDANLESTRPSIEPRRLCDAAYPFSAFRSRRRCRIQPSQVWIDLWQVVGRRRKRGFLRDRFLCIGCFSRIRPGRLLRFRV
jgi:hypothetical protein